jgi:hypothetical protein
MPRFRRADGLPGGGQPVRYYPGGGTSGGGDGLLIWLKPLDGPEWLAMVRFGGGVVSVFDQPDGRYVYANDLLINPDDPQDWKDVGVWPVRQAMEVGGEYTLFCDYSGIEVYGLTGMLWQNRSVVTDDLRIISVHANEVLIKGFEPAGGGPTTVVLDLLTGRELKRD